MKRWHEEQKLMAARQDLHESELVRAPFLSLKSLPLGRFRKRKPFDCGHSGCYVCHRNKLSGVPTADRLHADQDLALELEEAGAELSEFGLNANSVHLFRQITG